MAFKQKAAIINMEEIYASINGDGEVSESFTAPTVKDLNFYKNVIFSLVTEGAAKTKKLFGDDLSSMSGGQLNYSLSYYKNNLDRLILPEELMFIDAYCENVKSLPHAVSLDELMLNDEYIAAIYADIMSKRRALYPEYTSRPSVLDIFSIATEHIKSGSAPAFRYSELDVLSSTSDEMASLALLTKGCKPILSEDGVCIGKKVIARDINDHKNAAVIYGSADTDFEVFYNFLSNGEVISADAEIEVCKARELFPKLVDRFDNFTVDTSSIPLPKSGRFSNQVIQYNEIFLLELGGAFLTEELFGDTAILVYGNNPTIKKLCSIAVKTGLSCFSGIQADIKAQKKSKKASSSTVIKIKSSFYRILAELDGNLRVKLPDHTADRDSICDLIPTLKVSFADGKDTVASARADIAASPLPLHSAVYAFVSPIIEVASHGANLKNGELTLSVKAKLDLSDEKNTANSLSALLGLYKAETELSIPIESSSLELTGDGSSYVTVTAHAYTDSPAALSLGADSAKELLTATADSNGLPDFDMLLRLIKGE